MLEEWNTYERALSWFEQINCKGQENCIFWAYRDLGKHIWENAIIREVAGDIAGLAARIVFDELDKSLNELENYLYYLINETEYGIIIIPIESDGLNFKNARPLPERYVLIPKENIEKIQLKNYTVFLRSAQNLRIKLKNAPEIRINVNLKDRFIPYQEVSVRRFMNKYKNK